MFVSEPAGENFDCKTDFCAPSASVGLLTEPSGLINTFQPNRPRDSFVFHEGRIFDRHVAIVRVVS